MCTITLQLGALLILPYDFPPTREVQACAPAANKKATDQSSDVQLLALRCVAVVLVLQNMLEAVHTIHGERIVHSDLKPANFMLVQGQLKLIDFGIARAIQNDTTNIMRDTQVRARPVIQGLGPGLHPAPPPMAPPTISPAACKTSRHAAHVDLLYLICSTAVEPGTIYGLGQLYMDGVLRE